MADIFNYRSSSRAMMLRPKNNVRCKSHPDSLQVDDTDDSVPIWTTNLRKSLSPSLLHRNETNSVELDFTTPQNITTSSKFDPEKFQTLFLSSSNKPLDPMAVSAVHRTLVETPAPILAVHLTQIDLRLFGLNCSEKSRKKKNLWLLTDPFNR